MSAIRRYVYKAATVVLGGQDAVNLDYFQNPFQVNILADIVSGTATYTIEWTMDDLTGDPTAFRWISDTASQTTTKAFQAAGPFTGVRINIAAMTDEVRFSVIQTLRR